MESKRVNIEIINLVAGYSTGRNRFLLPVIENAHAFPGELVVLIGPNGSGKSTLLRTIAGIQKPVSGEILYGLNQVRSRERNLMAKIMGFVSTEQIHVPGMTVRDLVALGRYPYTNWIGRETEDDHTSVDLAIEKTGISALADRYFEELSDGERQRSMIARVLAQDPPVIVLDEPSAFLDISNRYEIVELLRRITIEEKKTVIFSTHDIHHALHKADRVWLIGERGLVEGAPEDLMLRGLLAQVFPSIKDPGSLYGRAKGDTKNTGTPFPVKGNPNEVKWTIRALERKGIRELPEKRLSIEIEKCSTGNLWKVFSDTGIETYQSILEMLSSPHFTGFASGL